MKASIDDNRISVVHIETNEKKYATHYATGQLWNRLANAFPTRVDLPVNTDEYRLFFVLPVGAARLDEETYEELKNKAERFLSGLSKNNDSNRQKRNKKSKETDETSDEKSNNEDSNSTEAEE